MRIAVIGCGSIGLRHIANLLAMGEQDVMVFDRAYLRAWVVHEQFGVDAPLGYFWEYEPDAVLICTPPETHVPLALEAIDHGCRALFIEKPLSVRRDVMALAIQSNFCNATTMVACNLRYHPGVATMRRWLDDGAIGDVLSARFWCGSWLPSWHGDGWDYRESYAANTGAILDVGSHEVDLALHLLGSATLRSAVVRPAASIGLPDTDGLAEMMLEHEGGVVSSVHVNFVQRNHDRGATIIGTKGTMGYSWGKQSAYCLIPDENRCHTVTWEDAENDEMYRRELQAFLAAVRDGGPSPNPVSSAVKTLDLLLEARSAWRGGS